MLQANYTFVNVFFFSTLNLDTKLNLTIFRSFRKSHCFYFLGTDLKAVKNEKVTFVYILCFMQVTSKTFVDECQAFFVMRNSITTFHVGIFPKLHTNTFLTAFPVQTCRDFIQMITTKTESMKSIMLIRLNDYLNAPFVLLTSGTSLHRINYKLCMFCDTM